MKFSLFTCLFSLFFISVFAQDESAGNKVVTAKFTKFYNANQPDSIFNLFSEQAKGGMPLDKTKAFIAQLHSNFGNIREMAFEMNKGGSGVYKTQFEKGLLTLSIAVEGQSIVALFAKPYEAPLIVKMARNLTKMALPFKGEWTVFWGGDTKEQNYHVATNFQKNAFDIVMRNAGGKSYKTDGKLNEDYYAFGQPLFTPADGEVVFAVDGVKDNKPGSMNPLFATGNSVLIKTQNNEFILFAHFKQYSVKVKQGDKVKKGQLLGMCGNSGNSSEPHLHFHLQDDEDFSKTIGIKCYFDELMVNGEIKKDYSPVQGDKIKPVTAN
ncbi:MAG: peptidoglycan DD-metalloendopeptidase family protein [Bacteroidota bacterium]